MKESCLDIGIIQAFLDGELVHDESARVSGHIAVCDACALMLAEADDESAVVFPALEREFNSLVPTQRLWNKINDSIAVEKRKMPFWQKAWAFLSVGLITPSLASAAGLLVVAGVVAAVWINRTPVSDQVVYAPASKIAAPAPASPYQVTGDVVTGPASTSAAKTERAAYRTENRRVSAVPAVEVSSSAVTSNGYMPGEESYVKTIASLSRSIDATKDSVMRPGERIAYERDMAVVDDAITKMRTEVKKNPKNESAKQVLYSSYQNKIDLLNSVSQKEELVASLK